MRVTVHGPQAKVTRSLETLENREMGWQFMQATKIFPIILSKMCSKLAFQQMCFLAEKKICVKNFLQKKSNHSRPQMFVGLAKMNQGNDCQSNLGHQWAYQMPPKVEKSNKPIWRKVNFSCFLSKICPILSKNQCI